MRRFSTFPPRVPHNRRFAFNPGAAATAEPPPPPSSAHSLLPRYASRLRKTLSPGYKKEGGRGAKRLCIRTPTHPRLSVRPSVFPPDLPPHAKMSALRKKASPSLPLLDEGVRTRREGQRGCLFPSFLPNGREREVARVGDGDGTWERRSVDSGRTTGRKNES